ncbi:MAG: hypothetical protein ACFB10_07565 [Salibacteraceae bacterium]
MNHVIKIAFSLLIVFCSTVAMAQNIFPEQYEGCNTDQFALESEELTANIDHQELLRIVQEGFEDKVKGKVSGVLSLQIIVNTKGESCLISVENKTNVKTKKLNLKSNIDSNLKWAKPKKKVAAIVVISFGPKGVTLKRMGMNGKLGWHELPLND